MENFILKDEINCPKKNLSLGRVVKLSSSRFLSLFEQIFIVLDGGYINFRILPPSKTIKICQKSFKKRRNLKLTTRPTLEFAKAY